MDTGIRRTLLNMIGTVLENTTFFVSVHYQTPTDLFPSALDYPAAHVVRQPEKLDDFTNSEKQSDFPFDIIAFVHGPNDLELLKTDAEDIVENALMSLQIDSDFTAIASMVKVDSADPTANALADLGVDVLILPPFGVVRMKCRIIFDYTVR